MKTMRPEGESARAAILAFATLFGGWYYSRWRIVIRVCRLTGEDD